MSFGERLKLIREKMGFTQQEISEKLKIPRTTYSGYESNSKREPDFHTLILISDLLEVSLDYLIKGKDIEQQNNIFVDRQLIQRLSEMEKEFEITQKVLDSRRLEIQDMKKLINR